MAKKVVSGLRMPAVPVRVAQSRILDSVSQCRKCAMHLTKAVFNRQLFVHVAKPGEGAPARVIVGVGPPSPTTEVRPEIAVPPLAACPHVLAAEVAERPSHAEERRRGKMGNRGSFRPSLRICHILGLCIHGGLCHLHARRINIPRFPIFPPHLACLPVSLTAAHHPPASVPPRPTTAHRVSHRAGS